MALFAFASTAVTIAVGCIVGATLLARAARNRVMPEFAVGLGLLSFYSLSRGLPLASSAFGDSIGHGAQLALLTGSTIGSGLGLFGLLLFTWWVFRRRSLPATLAFTAALLAIAVTRIGIIRDFLAVPSSEVPTFAHSPEWVGASVVLWTAAWVWASSESLRYHAKLRRRLRLDLADPVVADRFFLWGLGTGVSGLISASLVATTAAGMAVHSDAVPQLLLSIGGVVGPITWYLSFMPPDAYLDFVRDRARRAATSHS
jgi:hypothetical protein